jgi:1-acyl-sn-glycerol-3-phosphate acyltransferase
MVLNVFFRLTGGMKSVGVENIPQEGGVLFASIHLSYLDPPAVACGQNRRQLRFMAAEEIFRKPFFGWLVKSLGAFKVRRGASDTETIRKSIEILDSGETMLIFPEGTRGYGQVMGPFSKGVAMLAKKTQVPVVPVALIGVHKVWGKGEKKIKRGPILLAFGEPLRYQQFVQATGDDKLARQQFLDALEASIAKLCRDNGLPIKTASQIQAQPQVDPLAPRAESKPSVQTETPSPS